MPKVKKTHKIILFFILIFLLGIYSFTLYISNTIDQNKKPVEDSEIHNTKKPDREATQIN